MIMTKLRSAIVPLLFLGAFAILTAGNARISLAFPAASSTAGSSVDHEP